jgi:putative MATE family efflux protein
MAKEDFSPPAVIRENTPQREIIKKVLSLAFPIILSNLLYTVQNFVSLLLVAPLGKETIAGVGFASTLLWFVYATMATVYTGVSVLVAQKVGESQTDKEGNQPRAGIYLLWGILLSVFFSLPLTLAGESFIRFFLKLFSTPPAVVEVAVSYLKPIFLLLPLAFITNVFNAAFNGLGKTKVIFYATLFTTAVNIGLALILIYGLLGFPQLGAQGAGWAVAVAEALAIGVYLPFLLKEEAINPFRRWKLSFKPLVEILKVGLPTGVERTFMSFSYNVFVGLVALCGTSVLAAFQIGLRIESISFTVGMAFSFAATTLAGQNWGAKNPFGIEKGIKTTLYLAMVIMTSLGLLIGLFSPTIARFFTSDSEVIYWTIHYLWIIALSQPLMAIIFVLAGAIRGLGKTKIPLVVNISNFWLVRLIPSFILLKFFKTPYVPWSAMIAENITRSTVYYFLWKNIIKSMDFRKTSEGFLNKEKSPQKGNKARNTKTLGMSLITALFVLVFVTITLSAIGLLFNKYVQSTTYVQRFETTQEAARAVAKDLLQEINSGNFTVDTTTCDVGCSDNEEPCPIDLPPEIEETLKASNITAQAYLLKKCESDNATLYTIRVQASYNNGTQTNILIIYKIPKPSS